MAKALLFKSKVPGSSPREGTSEISDSDQIQIRNISDIRTRYKSEITELGDAIGVTYESRKRKLRKEDRRANKGEEEEEPTKGDPKKWEISEEEVGNIRNVSDIHI